MKKLLLIASAVLSTHCTSATETVAGQVVAIERFTSPFCEYYNVALLRGQSNTLIIRIISKGDLKIGESYEITSTFEVPSWCKANNNVIIQSK